MNAHKWRALVLVLALVTALAACSRSDGEEETNSGDPTTTEQDGGGTGDGGGRIAAGEFGDLGKVCQDGEASGASDTGVTDTEIKLGTITDKTNDASPGLNVEMYDTALAFADWCNANGGINGRQLVVEDLDAGLFQFADRIADACNGDMFALVGGGAVFDSADNGQRVQCGMPNIPGFVVTPESRSAELQVQPVPNPPDQYPIQNYRRMRELHPDATRMGIFYVELGGVDAVYRQLSQVVAEAGYEEVYTQVYNAIGETGWPNFVQAMKDADVQAVELIGEPVNMTNLLRAMQVANWYPEVITFQPNMYDNKFVEEASASAGAETNIYVRSAYPDLDSMADQIPALADYIELMDTHRPDGKYPALLGAQSLSAYLLFAKAAVECGNELTRQCLLEKAAAITEWTAGGLHAPTQPGNEQATPCGALLRFNTDGFTYDEEATEPDEGIFNCSPDNLMEVTG